MDHQHLRLMSLVKLIHSTSGRADIISMYRAALDGRKPMRIKDYPKMIATILVSEFPPQHARAVQMNS